MRLNSPRYIQEYWFKKINYFALHTCFAAKRPSVTPFLISLGFFLPKVLIITCWASLSPVWYHSIKHIHFAHAKTSLRLGLSEKKLSECAWLHFYGPISRLVSVSRYPRAVINRARGCLLQTFAIWSVLPSHYNVFQPLHGQVSYLHSALFMEGTLIFEAAGSRVKGLRL